MVTKETSVVGLSNTTATLVTTDNTTNMTSQLDAVDNFVITTLQLVAKENVSMTSEMVTMDNRDIHDISTPIPLHGWPSFGFDLFSVLNNDLFNWDDRQHHGYRSVQKRFLSVFVAVYKDNYLILLCNFCRMGKWLGFSESRDVFESRNVTSVNLVTL